MHSAYSTRIESRFGTMSEENAGGMNKPAVVKNSLLSAAATGFSFEDAPALLVPVSLQDEPGIQYYYWI